MYSVPVDISDYDEVLIFNLQRPYEGLLFACVADYFNKPYIFFPIYWDLDSLKMKDVPSLKTIIKQITPSKALFFAKSFRYYLDNRKLLKQNGVTISYMISLNKVSNYILSNAKHIIVNSNAEKDHLIERFGVEFKDKTHIVYNGTDINEKINEMINEENCSYLLKKFKLPPSFICCVGGIGPRKNQLNLIRAAVQTDINLVIIGKTTPGNMRYLKQIKKISNNNIHFVDHLSQQEVACVLSMSKGHIQPSFIETPGLASLEAASLNRPVCVSDVGPVREYFGDYAFYVDPHNIKSIKDGIENLYHGAYWISGKRFERKNYFKWDNVLEELLKYL